MGTLCSKRRSPAGLHLVMESGIIEVQAVELIMARAAAIYLDQEKKLTTAEGEKKWLAHLNKKFQRTVWPELLN